MSARVLSLPVSGVDCADVSGPVLAEAARLLSGGGLVALPTETVYGLAADATHDASIDRLYAAKGRPSHNPLICHVFDPNHAGNFVKLNPVAEVMIAAFWPGPLTLVLPQKHHGLSARATAGLSSLAVRCPDTSWRAGLMAAGYNGPIVMPSANRSGHISPTTAQHVRDDLGDKVDLIIDGGTCRNGLESTIISLIDPARPMILRHGAIPIEAIRDIVPQTDPVKTPTATVDFANVNAGIIAPGMLSSHYAPKARVRLNAREKRPDEVLLGFGACGDCDMNLSENGDLVEAARNLYGALRALDADLDANVTIAVWPIPATGLGAAINDRLNRAAADRPSEDRRS